VARVPTIGCVICQWSSNNPQLWSSNILHPSTPRSERWKWKFGGFADGKVRSDGHVEVPHKPGIGFESYNVTGPLMQIVVLEHLM
jgi:hypothetical protein